MPAPDLLFQHRLHFQWLHNLPFARDGHERINRTSLPHRRGDGQPFRGAAAE
jgi:hypothetical protein